MAAIENKHLAWALAEMSMLKYFPSGESGEMAQEAITRFLRRLVSTPEQLVWLVRELTDHVGHWPGPAEIRGLFCTRYKPADGVEADCSLPGYSAADGERKSAERDKTAAIPAAEARKLLEGLK